MDEIEKTFETITVNVAGNVRRETLNGRKFVVASVSMIRPGVWPGSDGPLLYPDSLIKDKPALVWNAFPILVKHPKDGNKFGSARSPKVLAEQEVGRIFAAREGEAVTAEAWLDEELTNKLAPTVIPDLEGGKAVEGSTGMHTVRRKAAKGATHNGKAYVAKVIDYYPDHYAILPEGEGACGVKDGCGILANELTEYAREGLDVVPEKDRPGFMARVWAALGLSPKREDAAKAQDLRSLTANELSFDQIHMLLDRALKAARSQDQPYCYISSVYDDYFVYEEGNELYRQGYEKSDNGVTLTGNPTQVVRQVNFVPVKPAEGSYVMNEADRKRMVDEITANCDCYKGQGELLMKFPEPNLKGIHTKVMSEKAEREKSVTANEAATRPFEADGKVYSWDGGKWVGKAKEVSPPAPTANAAQLSPLDPRLQAIADWVGGKMGEEKAALVAKITANAKDTDRPGLIQTYNGFTMEQLRAVAATLPAAPGPLAAEGQAPLYIGAGVAPIRPHVTENERQEFEADVLDMQAVYDEFKPEIPGKKSATA